MGFSVVTPERLVSENSGRSRRISPTDALRSVATGQASGSSTRIHACRIAETGRLEATLHANLALLFRAERYLAFAGADADVRRYGLTPASFDRGVRLGGEPDELKSLLERLLEGPIQEMWLAAIDRWSNGEPTCPLL